MRSTLLLTVLVSLSLFVIPAFPATNMDGSCPPTAPDPVFDPEAGEDVPTWTVGDFWNFTTEVEYDLGFASLTLTGWMNITVELFTLDLLGNGDPVYISNISGNISGEQFIPLFGDVKIYIDLTGYTWNRAGDLSIYRSIINASVSGNVQGINGDYPFGYEYSPPMEEFDFPLAEGDSWHINTSGRIPFGGSGELVRFEYNATCGSERDHTVPAGTFRVLPISFDGREVLLYNATVGRSIERRYHIGEGSTGIDVPFKLSTFHRGTDEKRVDLTVTTPQQVEAGSKFTVHGEASSSNVLINILFPGGSLAYTRFLAFPQKSFDAQLDAPMAPDSTPTLIDHGSFGIVAVINAGEGKGVATVTTKARDVEILPGDLEVIHDGDGTVDDLFRARITVRNPSNFGVSNLSLLLVMDDGLDNITTIEMNSDYHIDGRSVLEIYQNLSVPRSGNYTLNVIADPLDEIREYNETNNGAVVNFSVLPRPGIIWDVSPSNSSITLNEGEGVVLHARAERRGEELVGYWFMDGERVSTENDLVFNATFTGANSSRMEPYRFVYDVAAVPNQTYPGDMRTSVMFNITVMDVNRPFNLNHYSPLNHELSVLENDTIEFIVNATDPDGDELIYTWTAGNVTWNGTDRFNLMTGFTGNLSSSASPIMVRVIISDGRGNGFNISLNWSVTIIDVDRPFSAYVLPKEGKVVVDWNETLMLEYSAEDPDGTPVISLWEIPWDSIENITTLSINISDFFPDGADEFDINLTLRSGGEERNFSWHVEITGGPPLPEPTPYPPIGLRIVSPSNGEVFRTGDVILLSVEYEDDRELQIQWMVNGSLYLGNNIPIDDLPPGIYNISVKATALSGAPGEAELSVRIEVLENGQATDGIGENENRDTAPSIWALILLAAVAVTAIMVILAVVVIRWVRREGDFMDWEE